MRIGYFADGPWSHRALDRIIQREAFEIAFIVARFDVADPVLKEYADRLGVPYLLHANVNSDEFLSIIKGFKPDINVSMSFNQILKQGIINLAPLGFINCHAGLLPFYRGRNVLNWAIINGEKEFGVTVHHVDTGIDTGDIILQKHGEILETDDYSLVLNKAYNLCADTLFEALVSISEGTAPRIPQKSIHPVGFYCGRRLPGDEKINWCWPSERIHNFVRGITYPGPGARTATSEEVIVWKTQLIPEAPVYIGTPGEVVGRDAGGVIVKTGDSTIRITEIQLNLLDSSTSNRIIPKWPIGTRLKNLD